MNYSYHYERLIARARDRVLVGYSERHHIIPVCIGGDNAKTNIVKLTAEEHYVAHQLLVRIFPNARGLAIAAIRMAKKCTGRKAYGWLRRRHAVAASRWMMGQTHSLGYHHSTDAKEKIRSAQIGNQNGAGKARPPLTEDHKEKLRSAKLGIKLSPEHCANISVANSGKKKPFRALSAEHKAKVAAAHLGKKRSLESRVKMAAARKAWWDAKRNLVANITEERAQLTQQ